MLSIPLFDALRDLTFLSLLVRFLLAVLCGGVVGFDRVDEGGQIVRDLSVELDEADGMPSVASASDSADGRGSKPDAEPNQDGDEN